MKIPARPTLVDLAAERLRDGIRTGHWSERLPGIRPLATELGIGRHTLRAAFRRLVDEKLISEGAAGDPYTILRKRAPTAEQRSLNIGLLSRGKPEHQQPGMRLYFFMVMEALREAGHRPVILAIPKTADSSDTHALPRLAARHKPNVWIVTDGSREVLEWFSAAGLPVLAVGGRNHESDMAAVNPGMAKPAREIVRRLLALGHRRIVLLISDFSRKPYDSPVTRAFREELIAAGIRVGGYNIPDWDETPEGLQVLLDSLFRTTPPTALFCWPDEAILGTLAYLEKRGLRVPEDVSFACGGTSVATQWIRAGLIPVGMTSDGKARIRAIVRRVDEIAAGKNPRLKVEIPFVVTPGNTIGPAP